MFFKFFKKDMSQYRERGDRHFTEGRYSEARHEYGEALRCIDDTSGNEDLRSYLKSRFAESGNELARLNLQEADHALRRGDTAKAIEHAELAIELAEDETIRENAGLFLNNDAANSVISPQTGPSHSCSGCTPSHHATSTTDDFSDDFLSTSDQFELLIHPLPGDLPDRYRKMGEKFAYAYTALHNDRIDEGINILKDLARATPSDILDYEIALADFRQGRLTECEQGLHRAIARNRDNPLCRLGMVQLLVETGRPYEALPILEGMISDGHLADQAIVMLGDLLLMTGDAQAALDRYLSALNYPGVAKVAAQKAVPVLEQSGRYADAALLAKQYLKGCC